jgi:heme/copper-type cytochrome/quinol oxidase subunit 2
MEELARQIAVLQNDMAWVKGIINILLVAVVGLGVTNLGVTLLAVWQVRRNNNNRR